jgi:tetratricopeptide (TPR) repeat protein
MLSPKIRTLIVLGAVLAVVFLSYSPAIKSDFVSWDDDVHILDNITIRALDRAHIGDIFTATVNKIYIPLTSLSFAIEHHYFGYDPFIYHLDNFLLHLLVVAFVFIFARQMGLSLPGMVVAALLFGIHPMHVESVAWATERKDVLYAFFYMAALLSYGRYLHKGGYFLLAVTSVLGVLSMLAKPMALSLPLILLLLDWFKERKIARREILEKVPLCLLIAAITWVTYSAHARVPGEKIAQSLLIWPWTFVFYLRQFLFPFFSVPIYRLSQPVSLMNFEYLASLLALFLMAYALGRLRRYRWFLFPTVFYFFSIFFLLRFDEVKDVNIVADRFMYLPSLGFCLGLGFLGEWLWIRKEALRIPLVIGLGIVTAVSGAATYVRCLVWKDSISLWQHQLKFFPNEPIALNNLATALGDQPVYKKAQEEYGKIVQLQRKGEKLPLSRSMQEAMSRAEYLIRLYQRAIHADPDFADVHYNLGKLYSDIGMIPEALEAYKRALAIDPTLKDTHCGLGDLYRRAGDRRQAVFAYEQAIRFHPSDEEVYINVIEAYNEALKGDPEDTIYTDARKETLSRLVGLIRERPPMAVSYFNLAVILDKMGDIDGSVSAYRTVLEIAPRHSGALYNLGNLYRDRGNLNEAIRLYEQALRVNPRLSDAYLNIGIIHSERGRQDLAGEYYQKAMTVDPKNSRAYFNLGFMEEMDGNLRKAVDLYEEAVKCDARNAEGYYNLGNTYAKLKMDDQAIRAYLDAVSVNPKHRDAWVNLSILSFQKGDFSNAVRYCDEAILLGYEAPEGYLHALAPYRRSGKM